MALGLKLAEADEIDFSEEMAQSAETSEASAPASTEAEILQFETAAADVSNVSGIEATDTPAAEDMAKMMQAPSEPSVADAGEVIHLDMGDDVPATAKVTLDEIVLPESGPDAFDKLGDDARHPRMVEAAAEQGSADHVSDIPEAAVEDAMMQGLKDAAASGPDGAHANAAGGSAFSIDQILTPQQMEDYNSMSDEDKAEFEAVLSRHMQEAQKDEESLKALRSDDEKRRLEQGQNQPSLLGLVAALLAASVRKSPAKLIEQTAKRAEERPMRIRDELTDRIVKYNLAKISETGASLVRDQAALNDSIATFNKAFAESKGGQAFLGLADGWSETTGTTVEDARRNLEAMSRRGILESVANGADPLREAFNDPVVLQAWDEMRIKHAAVNDHANDLMDRAGKINESYGDRINRERMKDLVNRSAIALESHSKEPIVGNPDDPESQAKMRERMRELANRLREFFERLFAMIGIKPR